MAIGRTRPLFWEDPAVALSLPTASESVWHAARRAIRVDSCRCAPALPCPSRHSAYAGDRLRSDRWVEDAEPRQAPRAEPIAARARPLPREPAAPDARSAEHPSATPDVHSAAGRSPVSSAPRVEPGPAVCSGAGAAPDARPPSAARPAPALPREHSRSDEHPLVPDDRSPSAARSSFCAHSNSRSRSARSSGSRRRAAPVRSDSAEH